MTSPAATKPYHHGNLREALLGAALAEIGVSGVSRLSLRQVARRAGVSHAAPRHHFGDKPGLLAALAAEGFGRLAHVTAEASRQGVDLRDVGLAYIRFAMENPGHFTVMFRPDLYDQDAPDLRARRDAAARVLVEAVAKELPGAPEELLTGGVIAAWSISHGFATLWLTGNLSFAGSARPEDVARMAFEAMVSIARGTPPSTRGEEGPAGRAPRKRNPGTRRNVSIDKTRSEGG